MRLPNGYGSVYKLSGKRRRPWVARVTTSWKTNLKKKTGEQQFLVIGYYEKQQDAIDALSEYHRNPTTKTNISLGGLFEEWKMVKYKGISEQTQNNYNAAWLYLRKIEGVRVKDVRTGNMQAIIDAPEK